MPEHIHRRSWGMRWGLNVLAVQSERQWGPWNTTSALLVEGAGWMEKPGKIDLDMLQWCYKDITTRKTGIEYGLVTKFTLDMVLKTSYTLLASQVYDTITHASNKTPNWPRKDRKRYHCWAAIGHEFKSDINFYEVTGNTNGKMSQKAYIDKILEPIC